MCNLALHHSKVTSFSLFDSGMTCTNSVHDLKPDRPDWKDGCRIEFKEKYVQNDERDLKKIIETEVD